MPSLPRLADVVPQRKWLAAAALVPAVALAGWPIGAEFVGPVKLDVTRDGLEAVASMIGVLIPPQTYLPTIDESADLWGNVTHFEAWNLWIAAHVDEAHLVPGSGQLDLTANVTLSVNNPYDPGYIYVWEDSWFGDFDIAECGTRIDPFQVAVSSSVQLQIVDDLVNPPYLDATVGRLEWELGLLADDIVLDCWVGDAIDALDWVLDIVGVDLVQLILDLAYQPIDDQLQAVRPQIEEAIEGAFASATLEQDVPLGESVLHISVHPDNIEIVPEGVRVSAGGSFTSTTNPCVAEYGHIESISTDGLPGPIGSAPPSIWANHHIGATIDDDFVNSALFAAYNGGVLCYELTPADGLPLDTTLLAGLSQDVAALFPEAQPMIVKTRPAGVPTASATGNHDLNVAVEDLGVDFMAELEYRNALIIGADLDVDAGIDLNFDPNTGQLGVGIALSGDDLVTTVRSNEFVPEATADIEANFGGLFDTVLDLMLGSLTEGLGFGLPSISGLGVTQADMAASGPNGDWFGLYANVGTVTYPASEGCGGSGGGCETGCGTGGAHIPMRPVMFAAAGVAALIRRRR